MYAHMLREGLGSEATLYMYLSCKSSISIHMHVRMAKSTNIAFNSGWSYYPYTVTVNLYTCRCP